MFERYRHLKESGNEAEAEKYRLFGVRLDTSNALRDLSVEPTGIAEEDLGVNPRLVTMVRRALDRAWQHWDIPLEWQNEAEAYCRAIKIVVSGGFNNEKISRFEALGVPVDIYAVGSRFFQNDSATNTDFTTDVVRVKLHDQWVDMAKVGRQAGTNPALKAVLVSFPG